MKILVCGDRNWSNQKRLEAFLNGIDGRSTVDLLVEGECKGADLMGRAWAEAHSIPVDPHPADWNKYHRAAGPIRNREMLKANPDIALVIAFHNDIKSSKGTRDMVKASMQAGIPVIIVSETSHRYIDSVKIFVEGIDVEKYLKEI